MTLDLASTPRKVTAVGVTALATAALALPLWAQYRAAEASESGTKESLEQALQWQPGNAEFHNRLGRMLLYTPLGDPGRTLRELELATQLDPRSGQYWIDLAMLHEMRGDIAAAGAAIAKARAAEPRTPAILWFEANYLVRRGDGAAALERLKTLLAESPEYTVRALAFFSRVAEPSMLIEQAVPRRRESLHAAMDFVRNEGLVSAAPALWKALQGLDEAPSPGLLRSVVDWLITAQQVQLAQEIWNESARRGWLPIAADSSSDLLYNASFERPLENFGFDWRVIPHPEASVWMEMRGPAAGMQSLCVQFGNEARAPYSHITHAIAVTPNTSYQVKGSLRSERLISRGGAALVVSTLNNTELARTTAVTGTSPWMEVSKSFTTDAKTTLVFLKFARPAPEKEDEPASGLACMADLRLTQLGTTEGGARP